jgi:hypothetical protein
MGWPIAISMESSSPFAYNYHARRIRMVVRVEPLSPAGPFEKQILRTYLFLRVGIAGLAFAFPIILWIAGHREADVGLQDSMSDYYYAAGAGFTRDAFVGIQYAVGVFLILYQGYGKWENPLLDLAGALLIGVATFPNAQLPGLHNLCAVGFFGCIGIVCIKCAPETLKYLGNDTLEKRYRIAYRVIGIAMIISVGAAVVLRGVIPHHIFIAELCGIYCFSAYWFLKTIETQKSEVDLHAVRGHLDTTQVF